jgi:hypothetical protein
VAHKVHDSGRTRAGGGSFLYHASNTDVSATLDYVGIVSLGPAIAADLASRGGRYARTAALGVVFTVAATVVFRTLIAERNETRDVYIYVTQGIATALILWQLDSWQLWGGGGVLLGGTVAMVVAMAELEDCGHGHRRRWQSEIGRVHFWGHALVGGGVAIIAGQLRAHARGAAAVAAAAVEYK